ncbi:MAG: acyl-CoA thioesterase [Pseudonocardiaceae bacterium]
MRSSQETTGDQLPVGVQGAQPQGYVHTLRVRPVDTDFQGIVHAARYGAFFEAAMIETMRAAVGSYDVMIESGIHFVMAEINIRYLSPARFDDLLAITVSLRTLGTTSMIVDFDGRVADRPVVAAWVRYVALATSTGQKVPITETLRSHLCNMPRRSDS